MADNIPQPPVPNAPLPLLLRPSRQRHQLHLWRQLHPHL